MGLLYITGAMIYSTRIPERFYPGKFDYHMSSHVIWHFFTIAAAFVQTWVCVQFYFIGKNHCWKRVLFLFLDPRLIVWFGVEIYFSSFWDRLIGMGCDNKKSIGEEFLFFFEIFWFHWYLLVEIFWFFDIFWFHWSISNLKRHKQSFHYLMRMPTHAVLRNPSTFTHWCTSSKRCVASIPSPRLISGIPPGWYSR